MRFRLASVMVASWTMPCLPVKRIFSLPPLAAEMAAAQRGRAEALVVAGIFFIADAHMLPVEQPDDRGEDGVASSLRRLRSLSTRRAELGQRVAEFEAAFIFGGVLLGAVIGVIAILLAAARVLAGGLDMAVGILAEPGVGVGGGRRDGVQPVDLVAVGDALAMLVEIGPGAAILLRVITRLVVGAMTEHPFGASSLVEA